LDPPSVPCRNPVHKISDIEMPPFRHQARTPQQGHEKHEEDRDLFRKGEREVGQIAHNHIDEGDERQQSEDQARQVFFNAERDPGVGSIHGSGGFTLHGSSFRNQLVEDGRRIEYLSGHPRPGWHYVIGSDPSGGTGNDEAAYIVLCLETCEEVEEFGNSGINPVDFGLLLAKVGKKYNEAFQVCESNNHGIATHSVLLKVYPHQKIYKRHLPVHGGKIKYGFHTTEDTKCELVGAINTTFDTGLVLHGTTLVQEMKAFSEDPKTGQLGAKSDNRVIALGLACIGYIRYERFKSIDLPKREKKVYQPGSGMIIRFDEVLKNIEEQRQRKMGYFPNQLASRIN